MPCCSVCSSRGRRAVSTAHTRKANGKAYRYYVPIRKVRYGADASEAGRVPAEPIEQLVLAQVYAVLKAPEAVQAVWDAVRAEYPEISEPEVVLQLREIGAVWEQLFPEERRRIVQLLIERVVLGDEGLEITWRAAAGRRWRVKCARHHRCGIAGTGATGGLAMKIQQTARRSSWKARR
jgi:hypothetical protein